MKMTTFYMISKRKTNQQQITIEGRKFYICDGQSRFYAKLVRG